MKRRLEVVFLDDPADLSGIQIPLNQRYRDWVRWPHVPGPGNTSEINWECAGRTAKAPEAERLKPRWFD